MESFEKDKLCRLCLLNSEPLLDIFEMNSVHGYIAADVMEDLLQLEVSKTDVYPHFVCEKCLDKLTEFNLFKNQCHISKATYDNVYSSDDTNSNDKDCLESVNFGPIQIKSEMAPLGKDINLKVTSHPTSNNSENQDGVTVLESINPIKAKKKKTNTTLDKAVIQESQEVVSQSQIEDEFSAYGIIVATKLRSMETEQRLFAENVIHLALFLGIRKQLTASATVYLSSEYISRQVYPAHAQLTPGQLQSLPNSETRNFPRHQQQATPQNQVIPSASLLESYLSNSCAHPQAPNIHLLPSNIHISHRPTFQHHQTAQTSSSYPVSHSTTSQTQAGLRHPTYFTSVNQSSLPPQN